MKKIRTRYAPSPTGFLHIGGARTALFNYLLAKKYGGTFILRIEDTDVKRNVIGGEKSQIENLKWMHIEPDEYPGKENPKYGKYRQSEKILIYQEFANQLIKKGLAYKAFDNENELIAQKLEQKNKGISSFRYDKNWLKISEEERAKREKNNQFSIRISLPKNKIFTWNDLVRGKIAVNSNDIGDFIIIKSDGFPTYNFAVVIDDHQMEISHVLRGEEHITNTPKQLVIYHFFNWQPPEFGHLTIITNLAGQKLSKRDNNTTQFIENFKDKGYEGKAIFNFLTLLGWTAADASEIMSIEEIINKFDIARLSKSPSKFDEKKLEWFAKKYFQKITKTEIKSRLLANNKKEDWLDLFIETYQSGCSCTEQLNSFLQNYLNPKTENYFTISDLKVVNFFWEKLKDKEFTIKNIENSIWATKKELKVSGKDLFLPIRIATTYENHGPELAKTIYLFGKKIIFERLKKYEN